MKRILLVEDGRPFWPRIRDLLAKVNAVVEEVCPGDSIAASIAARPDLVVIGDTGHAARPPGWWGGALLVFEKGRAPDLVTPIGSGSQQVAASSSIGERAFLSLTSRLLGVSERRLFRAVIGVRRAGKEHLHMGASREFSLTGLSFSLGVDLLQNERVLISFYVPGARSRVALQGEVVRSFPDPEDGSSCFGARFVGLSAEELQLLKRFVWAEE
ncbi:MAG: PilZ domain-containing protein [Candidatus Methylomirabilia bacterium]